MSETLILGGGLAGGAAALLLAREGVPVHLLERESAPRDKICGEFLSIEAQRDLQHLGLNCARLGAVAIDRVRLISGASGVEARLPFVARGLSRKVLDEVLLEMAAAAGARIERGLRATGIAGREVATSAGPREAGRILLATGKHDLRGARRREPMTRHGYVGFKMHWRVSKRSAARLAGAIELVLLERGYAGLQLVAPDVLNLCLVIRREALLESGGTWEGLLANLLNIEAIAWRLADAEPLFPQPLTIANLPYGYVCDAADDLPGNIYRLGDQAAMTASLTGDGMALALRSALIAAASLRAGENAAVYHARIRRVVSPQVRRAMLLQRVSESPVTLRLGFGLLRLFPHLLTGLAGATRLSSREDGLNAPLFDQFTDRRAADEVLQQSYAGADLGGGMAGETAGHEIGDRGA